MSDLPLGRKLETAQMMHAAIKAIVQNRIHAASQSQYDRKVCVLAVMAARNAVETIPVDGTTTDYGQAVVAVLDKLHNTYNDPDGEYTSGRGIIGDVYFDVLSLLDDQSSPEKEL